MIDNDVLRAFIKKNKSENKPSTTESIIYDILYFMMNEDKDKIGSLKIFFSCFDDAKKYLNNIIKETYKLEDINFKIHYAEYEVPIAWRLDGSHPQAPKSCCYSINPERNNLDNL